MIGLKTQLEVADNSGTKRVWCIGVLGRGNKKLAGIGDIITGHVRESAPDALAKKGELVRCVIVRTRAPCSMTSSISVSRYSSSNRISSETSPRGRFQFSRENA